MIGKYLLIALLSVVCYSRRCFVSSFHHIPSSSSSALSIAFLPRAIRDCTGSKVTCATARYPSVLFSHKQKLRLLESFEPSPMKRILDNVGITAKYVVSGIAAASLLTNQSPLPLYYTICALANSAFGKVMKKIIKDPRPAKSPKPGYGMPSSHTNAIAYFSYIVLHSSPYFLPQESHRKLLAIAVVLYGISACYWRIVTHLHTPLQICVGGALGLFSAFLASRQENVVLSLLREHPPSLALLLVVKALVFLLILPVVFKHELKWMRKQLSRQHQ